MSAIKHKAVPYADSQKFSSSYTIEFELNIRTAEASFALGKLLNRNFTL